MTKGLLLVDIQNDYFLNGKMELVGMEKAANNASKILESFRQKELPVFHIQHVSIRPGSSFFLPDTNGVEINEAVKPNANEPVITKYFPNSFRETELLDQLKKNNIKELVICGAMSHMCIDTTTRAAFDLNFNCTLIEDACATRNLEFKNEIIEAEKVQASFMAALSYPFARVISTEEFIKEGNCND